MKNGVLFLILFFFLISNFVVAEDISVWQGQYYSGSTFYEGTYSFNFTVYDASTGGNICYSNTSSLTTGSFGEWKTTQYNVGEVCNVTTSENDYWLNINIAGADQGDRRLLRSSFMYLRKDVDDEINGTLVVNGTGSNLVVEEDITAGGNVSGSFGFFTYLGSLSNRVTKLSVQDIAFSGVINGSGNINISGEINTTSNIKADGNVTGSSGLFDFLGDLTNRITKIFSTNLTITETAEIEALQIKRYDTFGPAILLNNTADAIRIVSAPNITDPISGAGIQLYGITEAYFPGDVFIDAGSVSGGEITFRTGASGLNTRMVIDDSGNITIEGLSGTGNDYACLDSNGKLYRSSGPCIG